MSTDNVLPPYFFSITVLVFLKIYHPENQFFYNMKRSKTFVAIMPAAAQI